MKNFEDTGIKKLISLIKAKFDSLAKVATSGSYNDLSDKPTIPSVGNGRITIKQGGITKGTFTVNQSGATGIELTDNDTHYASGTVVTNDATKTGNYGAALTNGNVHLNHVENGAVKNSHKITGSGATTVTSDASGNIIITSTDNNTTYGVATSSTLGLVKSGTDITVDSSGNVSVNDDSHSHSDYVKKSGSEVSSLNAITAETSTTRAITPNGTAIASSPFARDFWHDRFAFLRGETSIIDNQVSTDGTTWTDDDSDLTPLFIQKETHGTTILSTSQLAHRFTMHGKNIAYSYIEWFEIGVSYTNPFSSFEVHIESSSDNSSWSTAHKSIVSGNSVPVFLKQNKHTSSDGYLRFTFTKTTNTTTGSVNISCLKAFTYRKGNQGLGIDYEYPYDWNSNMDIYPVTNNKSTLGTSGRKWANIYATKFTGALAGNAGTATKWQTARNINGMLVQGDANRVNYGVCSTAATTAAKTVNCAGFTLITGAEITVKFTNTNSAAQPTLNVNNQGAKAIYYRGNYIPPTCLAKDRVYTFRYDGTNYELVGDINTDTNTDTKNTAGSTDTSSKIFLIGAKSQAANPQTYSHDTAYVGTDGCLYSGGAKVSVDGHTHTKSEITDFPTSLKNPNGLRVQVNGDGASEVRYDGSEAKTINFVAGDNVTLTQKTSENKVTIAAKDTTYSAGTGLSLSGTTFKHSNSVTAGTAQGDASKTLTFGGTFTVPTVTYDAQGHVTGKGTTTMTMPANPNTDTKVTQAVTTINDEFPLLLAPNGQTTNATTTAYFDSGVTLNPSTNTIAANISGSASTANSVTNALTVKTDGSTLYTYDGSAAKTINIKAGSNVTITSDNSGNIIINSSSSSSGDAGVIVYEAESGGLYCDGSTAKHVNVNACEIQDNNPNGYYKRFRFYCQGYFGLVCVDMPLDRQHSAYGATDGTRYGGVIFPTAENGNINSTGIGPSNHMYYELKWKVTKEPDHWTVQVVDSGWLGLNAGKTSDANYTENASTSDAGTGYVSWNQRHNNQYCIYKIVAYTI